MTIDTLTPRSIRQLFYEFLALLKLLCALLPSSCALTCSRSLSHLQTFSHVPCNHFIPSLRSGSASSTAM